MLSSDGDRLADYYGLDTVPVFGGGYNVAPSSPVPVVRRQTGKELALCHWGFIPHWVKEPVLKPINARAETLAGKPYFRDAFKRRRCLVPANGYYEWRAAPGGKQPYFIRMAGAELFSFAGLWSVWQGTGRAGGELRHHHDIGQGGIGRHPRPDAGHYRAGRL